MEWLPREEVLILLTGLAASALLVLGVLEAIWPTRRRRARGAAEPSHRRRSAVSMPTSSPTPVISLEEDRAEVALRVGRTLLTRALEDPDPVLIFENQTLYPMEGQLAADAGPVEIEHARIHRAGRDVTIITYGASLWKSLAAAQTLAGEGIEAEVIDLRTLRPLDNATFLESIARTHRAVIVDEGWRSGGISAEIGMRIMECAFFELEAPVERVCTAEVPIPYPKHLEDAALPQAATIASTVRRMLRRG